MPHTQRIIQLLSLVCIAIPAWAAPTISDAWIPEAPPVSTVMAGFMILHNPDVDAVKIVAVQSEQFADVQMHLSLEENGIAKMLPQKMLIVPAQGSLQLKPGSYHLMLFNPVAPLKAGDKVTLNIRFENGDSLPVIAEVKKATARKSTGDHMKMKMDGSHRCY